LDATEPRVTPMFPLGMVLLPGAVLPLHVFEMRYRVLMRDVLDAGGELGVVLIERGSEVGGGDVRSEVGTMARVVRADELADGRWAVVATGERRIRVTHWEPDDPYPRARVEDWPDEAGSGIDEVALVAAASTSLETVRQLAGQLGLRVAAVDPDQPAEPSAASFALASAAPIGPLDRQRLLAAPGAGERLEALLRLLDEEIATLGAQLRMGDW
jgi:Lon protease-like protein